MRIFLISLFCSITLTTSAQKPDLVSFEQLQQRYTLSKDTTYVVNFWATWCGPCVKELPHFDRLTQEYAKAPLKVLLVSLDFKSKLETVLVPFIKSKGIQSEVLVLNETDANSYINRVSPTWSGAIPATLIITKNNRTFFEQEFDYEELKNVYLQSLNTTKKTTR